MLKFAIFVIIGALLGMVLRFWGFAFAICVLLVIYAWLHWQGTVIPLWPDLALVAVALQVGYFIYILIALIRHRRSRKVL